MSRGDCASLKKTTFNVRQQTRAEQPQADTKKRDIEIHTLRKMCTVCELWMMFDCSTRRDCQASLIAIPPCPRAQIQVFRRSSHLHPGHSTSRVCLVAIVDINLRRCQVRTPSSMWQYQISTGSSTRDRSRSRAMILLS